MPAPASCAPAITCRPTPPHPITHTLAPTRRPARLTAPIPVTTPQPSSAACHSGIEAGSRTAPAAGTTAYSAKQATIRPCWSTVPSSARSRELPSISIPATPWRAAVSHSVRRPDRQARQAPHDGTKQNATWSPATTSTTSSPTATTTPAPSCPSTIGHRPPPSCPSARWTSE